MTHEASHIDHHLLHFSTNSRLELFDQSMSTTIMRRRTTVVTTLQILWLLLLVLHTPTVTSLAVRPAPSAEAAAAAELARSRLTDALSSPSGKLSLSPELVIPDPSSPTAILLQSTAITSLSNALRIKAKANAAFLSGTVTSLKIFCNEQEEARGNFPGPLPVIYCSCPGDGAATDGNNGAENAVSVDMADVAEAGAAGILVPVCDGREVTSTDEVLTTNQNDGDNEARWVTMCQEALSHGLQPIPEVFVAESIAATWKEPEIESLVMNIAKATNVDPVSVLITINAATVDDDEDDDDDDDDNAIDDDDNKNMEQVSLPAIPKALGRKTPIMGSVRATAGANRLSVETARLKAAGFTGAVLRRECVPGFQQHQTNVNLEFLSDFWSACIGDLKSTRSKTFDFRSKNLMEKSVPLEWARYQKDVMESGALGEAEDYAPGGLNPESGDYHGF